LGRRQHCIDLKSRRARQLTPRDRSAWGSSRASGRVVVSSTLRERAVGEQRVQHRLAAILAADAAGYGRVTVADEEGSVRT
jgi:hypothetical protein